jgi:hypothetical protein
MQIFAFLSQNAGYLWNNVLQVQFVTRYVCIFEVCVKQILNSWSGHKFVL